MKLLTTFAQTSSEDMILPVVQLFGIALITRLLLLLLTPLMVVTSPVALVSVGDITTGRKPAYVGRVNFISNSRVLKPKKIDEGPRPVVGLRLVSINWHLYVNLYFKIGIRRDQPGYEYRPVLGLCEPTGVTRVYKGTTRRRFRTTDNNSRLRRSLFAP